jgi:hypothetical protein
MTTELEIPVRMATLPRDHRGFVVPYFVAWLDETGAITEPGTGTPDFRVIDTRKFSRCITSRHCWLCGEQMGVRLSFVIGPMCAVSRVTSEPGCHLVCARYAVKVCPFLTKPRMRRHDKVPLPEGFIPPAGTHLERNPGCMAIWVTREFKRFRVEQGRDGMLFQIGEPEHVEWWREGRPATRAEVDEAIESGMPFLANEAKREGGDALRALEVYAERVMHYLPAA